MLSYLILHAELRYWKEMFVDDVEVGRHKLAFSLHKLHNVVFYKLKNVLLALLQRMILTGGSQNTYCGFSRKYADR